MAACQRCGHELEILRKPLQRLKGTGYRWRGFVSLFTQALRNCPRCGAVYTGDGVLLAAGVVETNAEVKIRSYVEDMAHLRDAFAAVTIGAELMIAWMWFGPETYGLAASVISAVVGTLALPPFVFFAKQSRRAARDLKRLREARIKGDPPPPEIAASRPRSALRDAP